MSTITIQTELETLNCYSCRMPLALESGWVKKARELAGQRMQFHCPYCAAVQGWGGKSVKDRLMEEKSTLERQLQWAREQRDNAAKEAEHFRKSRDGMKGALSKERKRIQNGVCPCCARTFRNLRRHMAVRHPDHAKEKAE